MRDRNAAICQKNPIAKSANMPENLKQESVIFILLKLIDLCAFGLFFFFLNNDEKYHLNLQTSC